MNIRTQPKMKLLKLAWRRDDSVPAGTSAPGRFPCPCGDSSLVYLIQGGDDIICNCGRRYSWEGCIKGRSSESDTLTAYHVIFADGSSYVTSMAAEINLQRAYYYFVGMVIDEKTVVDVEPNEILKGV